MMARTNISYAYIWSIDMNDIEYLARFITEDVNHKHIIKESSLSKLYDYATKYDCAIISANRGNPADSTNCAGDKLPNLDDVYGRSTAVQGQNRRKTKKYTINQTNTAQLKGELQAFGYVVVPVRGAYLEELSPQVHRRVSENSFFVVNVYDDIQFNHNMSDLGIKYCQDSVLLSPKGATSAYLVGTNNAEWPGLGGEARLGRLFAGEPEGAQQFHTRVNDRPFSFREQN
jgi:hypothetical protein